VRAPGIAGLHRVDWLYSASGLAMEGQGIGLDRRIYRFAGPYSLGWVNVSGAATRPCIAGRWSRGRPAWLAFGWRNARGDVTFPLAGGGWSHGSPARFLAAPRDLRFASGPSRPLAYWRSVAVDRRLIPFGSRIFVPAYCARPGRGWFTARDTGGAILGRHIDVYRPAPSASDPARKLTNQRVFVVPPGRHASETRRVPRCPRR
jgi:3D (Asp-Asp-Asp) domain-containing protein